MNIWPSTLPQFALRDGYQSGTGDGRLRSDTDAGIAKVRRRFSYVPRPLSLSTLMTNDQLDTFKTFYDDTLQGGVLPFQVFSAEGADPIVVQFGQNAPTWVPNGIDWTVTLDLVILP
jgi:hypothetical protein